MRIKYIFNFIEGNVKYYYNKLIPLPQHIQEQIVHRLLKCKDDCMKTGKCMKCGSCPVEKKAFLTESCNRDRFPDLMDNISWENFKKEKGING